MSAPKTWLLDTDTLIYLLKGRPLSVGVRIKRIPAERLCVSTVSLAELAYGAEKSTRREQALQAATAVSERFTLLPFDTKAAFIYGQVRAGLERGGKPIGANDLLIAAQALAVDSILVTNNTREFSRVAGLHLENWV